MLYNMLSCCAPNSPRWQYLRWFVVVVFVCNVNVKRAMNRESELVENTGPMQTEPFLQVAIAWYNFMLRILLCTWTGRSTLSGNVLWNSSRLDNRWNTQSIHPPFFNRPRQSLHCTKRRRNRLAYLATQIISYSMHIHFRHRSHNAQEACLSFRFVIF